MATDTSDLLKQEINKTLEDLHDFAKWKLIVVSALASAALGLVGPNKPLAAWLVVFVPFACAYVDLNCYQYLLRIFLIAKVLRGRDIEDPLLHEYEKQCEKYRSKGLFSFGLFAQVGCSVSFSVVLLGLTIGLFDLKEIHIVNFGPLLTVWLLGLAVVVACYMVFKRKKLLLEK